MKNSIIALTLGLLLGFTAKAQDNKAVDAKAQADFKFETEEYNFGTVKQGEIVNHEFKFTNTGKEPLVITDARGSCGCTVPEWPKESIKKGQSANIKVTFSSAGKLGLQDKTVTINSNAKSGPKVLHLKGNVAENKSEVPAKK